MVHRIIIVFSIIAFIALLAFILYLIFRSNTQPSTQPPEQTNLKDIITFNSSSNVDYSAINNIQQKFIMGTFVANIMLTKLSFTFDKDTSIFNNSNVIISIEDSNKNQIYNTTITNFTFTIF